MNHEGKIDSAFWALRLGLGASTFLAGADKFTNLLTDWKKYLAPEASKKIPVSDKNYMRLVGVIEMMVGLGILSRQTRFSSYAAGAWLLGIAGNLWLNEDYDIAVRDINMALAAFALAKLTEIRQGDVEEEDLVDRRLHAA